MRRVELIVAEQLRDIVRKHAPDAVVFQGPMASIRWPGSESGMLPYPAWNSLKKEDLATGVATVAHSNPDGDAWAPLESNTTLYNHNWFWSPENEHKRKSLKDLIKIYYHSVGRGSLQLLNSTPNTDGLIPTGDMKRYKEYGDEIIRRFSNPLAETQGIGNTHSLTFDKPTLVNQLMLMEDYRHGERIRRFFIEGKDAQGTWHKLNTGSAVGRKRIIVIAERSVTELRLTITKNVGTPLLRSMKAYYVKDIGYDYLLEAPPSISIGKPATASHTHTAPYNNPTTPLATRQENMDIKKRMGYQVSIMLSLLTLIGSTAAADMRSYDIRHTEPASSWRGASPLGNGRLGAMVNGGTRAEIIQLNDDTLWSGEPLPHLDGKKHRDHLEQIRALIFAGKHQEATALGQRMMLGRYNQCYMPLGNLKLTMPNVDTQKVTDYDRSLNLNRGISVTKFSHAGVNYQRSVLVSYPDQVMVVHLTASEQGAINLQIGMESLLENRIQAGKLPNRLWMTGRAPIHADPHYEGKKVTYDQSDAKRGMRFAAGIQIRQKDGNVKSENGMLIVEHASEVTIQFAAATSYNGFDHSPSAEGLDEKKLAESSLDKAKNDSAETLYRRHVKDHSALFSRVDIQLGDTKKQGEPVSLRVGKNVTSTPDPDLDELFYQFGRYLLIASSRIGSQPANLQGIWSYKMNPSWSANWTMNCNAQFNYMGAGTSGLADLGEPLQRLAVEASVDGAKVAKSWYGSDGWVFHHNIDLWRDAIPSGGNVLWATFPTGGTWTTVELFDLWRFRPDKEALRKLWPLMQGNVEFWLGNLVVDPDSKKLVSCPDVYFENRGKKPDGQTVLLCAAPVSSTIMIKQSFLDLLEAAEILDLGDDPVVVKATEALRNMPNIEVGPNGEIRQWGRDLKNEWKESDSTQLLVMQGAIYSNQIHPRRTPELAKALSLMLERRKNGLDGQASWRAAFPANTYARLGQGNKLHQVLTAHYKKWSNPNLTARFIQSDWEIDGNLGLMSSIQEALVQSHAGEVELLPALPDAWKREGFVKGLALRGGCTISFAWKDGKVTTWSIEGKGKEKLKVRVPG